MKKLVLLLSFVLISNILFAQYKSFQLGIKVSPTISWLNANDLGLKSEGVAIGFNGGLMGEINFTKNYMLLTGINFNHSKGKISFVGNSGITDESSIFFKQIVDIKQTVNLQYIEIPLALKLRTNELIPKVKFFGIMGLNSAFRINAKANNSLTFMEEVKDLQKVDVSDNYSFIKESLLLGIGGEFFIDKSSFVSVGINFNTSLNNVSNKKFKNYYEGEWRQSKITLTYIELCLAFVF